MMTNAGTAAQDALYDMAPTAFGKPTAAATTDNLQDLKWLQEMTERMIRENVAALREQGLSWAAVGTVLGVSAQAAHKRFSDR